MWRRGSFGTRRRTHESRDQAVTQIRRPADVTDRVKYVGPVPPWAVEMVAVARAVTGRVPARLTWHRRWTLILHGVYFWDTNSIVIFPKCIATTRPGSISLKIGRSRRRHQIPEVRDTVAHELAHMVHRHHGRGHARLRDRILREWIRGIFSTKDWKSRIHSGMKRHVK